MLKSILENIIVTAICTGIATAARRIYQYLKSNDSTGKQNQRTFSKKLVHHQFLISLFSLAISLPTALLLPVETILTAFLKIILFIVAGFSFIFAWGAFDAAFSFYPGDDSWPDSPTDEGTQ